MSFSSQQLNHNCEELDINCIASATTENTAKMALSHEVEFRAFLSLSPSVQLRQSTQSVQSMQLKHTVQSTTTHELEASSKSERDAQQSMLTIFAPDTSLKMEER